MHRVRLNDFYIGKYEVTVGQWKIFIRETGYETDRGMLPLGAKGMGEPGFSQDDNHPVVCVWWEDAKAFAAWLSVENRKAIPVANGSAVGVCGKEWRKIRNVWYEDG